MQEEPRDQVIVNGATRLVMTCGATNFGTSREVPLAQVHVGKLCRIGAPSSVTLLCELPWMNATATALGPNLVPKFE